MRSIGDTLKAFAPTIRELTQVSTELKSTLEEEIGLNELREEFQRPLLSTPPKKPAASAATTATTTMESGTSSLSDITSTMRQVDDSIAKALDPEIDRRREEAAKMAWGGASPAAAIAGDGQEKGNPLADLSLDELEKELQRRKAEQQQQ